MAIHWRAIISSRCNHYLYVLLYYLWRAGRGRVTLSISYVYSSLCRKFKLQHKPIHKQGGQVINDYKLWVIVHITIQQSNGWCSGDCELYLFCRPLCHNDFPCWIETVLYAALSYLMTPSIVSYTGTGAGNMRCKCGVF